MHFSTGVDLAFPHHRSNDTQPAFMVILSSLLVWPLLDASGWAFRLLVGGLVDCQFSVHCDSDFLKNQTFVF